MNKKITYLREDGGDVRGKRFEEPVFVPGDHLGLTEEKVIEGREHEVVSVGPLHAEHYVVILHNEMGTGEKSLEILVFSLSPEQRSHRLARLEIQGIGMNTHVFVSIGFLGTKFNSGADITYHT